MLQIIQLTFYDGTGCIGGNKILRILPARPGIPGIWDRFSSHPLYRKNEVTGVLLLPRSLRPLRPLFIHPERGARNNRPEQRPYMQSSSGYRRR